ncbi:MAG: TetR family transcriptional regulator [Fimbriimonadaceae bacterium]|jgi:AcrR family transcriptional regulator|nr:TetR family transcriptional regulator [Fimbriimonadaceae bacterium]
MKSRRPEILKAAYDLTGIQGLESLHARTVATELGINHATVHYYFPSRTDLLVGVADYALAQFRADRAKFQEESKTPKDKAEAEIALAEAYCKKTSRFVKVLAGLYVASVNNLVLRKKLQELFREWMTFLKELEGLKIRKSSPYQDAELLVCTFLGVAMASHMMDGKLDTKKMMDSVYESMLG